MKAIWRGHIIADSNNPIVIECNYYFPPEAVDKTYFHPSKRIYLCYWKGIAHYYHIGKDGELNKNAAWYYPKPTRLSKKIMKRDFANYIAFDYQVKVTE